jgi:hypothetical protein
MHRIPAAVAVLLLCACAAPPPPPTTASAAASVGTATTSVYGDWEYVATSGGKRTTGRFCIARTPAPSRFVVDAAGVDSDVADGALTIDGARVIWRGVVASPGGSTSFEIDATIVGPARMEGTNHLRQSEPPHRTAAWQFVATRPVD